MKTITYILLLALILIPMLTGFQCASAESTSGKLYIQRGDWDNARKSLEKAVERNPQDAEAWYLLGVAQKNLADYQNAIRSFSQSLKLDPSRKADVNTELASIPESEKRDKSQDFAKEFESALDDSNYIQAESIRQDWLDYLESEPSGLLTRKEQRYLRNLRGIVGLADPVLVPLRTKLLLAIKNNQYDDALKIQQLILNRENQLLASSTRGEDTETRDTIRSDVARGNEPIRIEHQNVPRYGATDVGEQLGTLLQRRLSEKERAGLKLIDIFLGR